MSQDVVTNQMASDSLEGSMPSQVWSVEDYADKLMDELFEDVDRVVEGGTSLPTETTPIETPPLQTLAIPQMILASALMPRQGLTSQPVRREASDTALVETDGSITKHHPLTRSFDKLLLGAACASIIVTILIWLGSQGRLGRFFPASNSTPTVTAPAPTAKELADAQFGEYVQRSLEVIAQLDTPNKQVAAVPTTAPQPAGTLPTVPVTGNLAQPPTRIPSALERIYTLPKIPQRPYKLPAPVAPVSPRPVVVRPVVPMPRVAPAPVASAPVVPVAPAAPAAPAPKVTLQGVVEWGDRSAALFEIGGSTQRINLGENIGSSGWTLVKVNNQEAMIRRNGEVRSVYVGQQF
ncbi:MAG: hypothetical protein KME12_13960 [Trichocoleus desertorum ATA4-8-CV12]|nr:hypothetical protein [Trichocoleus desertorum ATA4-8-CV12]